MKFTYTKAYAMGGFGAGFLFSYLTDSPIPVITCTLIGAASGMAKERDIETGRVNTGSTILKTVGVFKYGHYMLIGSGIILVALFIKK